MLNSEDKARDQARSASREPKQPPPAKRRQDAALELGEIRLIQPLGVTDEDPGGDPYNHTGRFTVKKR